MEDIRENWMLDTEFVPLISKEEREERIKGWKKSVACTYGYAKTEG